MKNQTMEYEGKRMPLINAIHLRMMRHYAIAEFLGLEKNFSAYFRFKVFPRVFEDKPYLKAKDYWITDCHIKKYFDKILNGFEKTTSIMGKRLFRKEIDKLSVAINDMASAAIDLHPKRPK